MIAISNRLISSARGVSAKAIRSFSTECAPAQRLRETFADYRGHHFSRETPYRFKKEILQPYLSTENNSVDIDQLNILLTNIGYPQQCLSVDE